MADINAGSYRISGRYGYAMRDARQLFEVTSVTATLTIGQTEVVLAGVNKTSVKDGTITRSGGQLMMQKIDSRWEDEMYAFISTDLATQRKNRDAGTPANRAFSMQIWLDDPSALGAEAIQLDGCRLFNLPMGFNASNDLETRTWDFRWESEQLLQAFEIQGSQTDPATGLPAIAYTYTLDS